MNELIHADIFFFIASIGFILVALILAVVLLYAISIMMDIKHISRRIREEGDDVIDDLRVIRKHIVEDGISLGGLKSALDLFFPSFFRKNRRRRD